MVSSVSTQDATAQPGALPPTKRGLELVMLAFATIVVTTALVLVELNQPQGLTPGQREPRGPRRAVTAGNQQVRLVDPGAVRPVRGLAAG